MLEFIRDLIFLGLIGRRSAHGREQNPGEKIVSLRAPSAP